MVVLPQVLVPFLEGGNSLLVGTCDSNRMPQVARAVGLKVATDRSRFTLFLPERTAARSLAALAQVPLLAVTCSEPPTHRTVQVKGKVVALRAPNAEEQAWVLSYPDRFANVVAYAGLARATVMRLHVWPARAIDVEATDLFDQTPGPKAGAPLDPGSFEGAKKPVHP
ncbi:MAG: pyridoxamine 5'-phosphate oxidase family protein [Myxococcales bacterium]